MSGLDEFDWNISEPSLKPSPNMADLGGASFFSQESAAPPAPPSSLPTGPQIGHQIGKAPGTPPKMPAENEFVETPAFDLPDLPDLKQDFAERESRNPSPIPEAPKGSLSIGSSGSGDDRALDELVKKQVEEVLGKMIQKVLPDVAERLIKEEIRRLLSEQP
jgi:hypothetical protein